MYDRIIARLVEKNCRAYRLFTTTGAVSPRNPDAAVPTDEGDAA
jgi:hypothetical protein